MSAYFQFLQPWITPSIFDDTGNEKIVDEWTFGQYMDKNEARNVLEDHWDSWITEDDFEDIADAGWVTVLDRLSRVFRLLTVSWPPLD